MTPLVAVRMNPQPDMLGEWLADASAFDAAGADALWVEVGAETGLDPLTIAAALAVVTSGSRLVLSLDGVPSAAQAQALETVRRLSRDRLTLLAAAESCGEVGAAVPALPLLARGPGSADPVSEGAGFGLVEAEGPRESGGTERWLSAPAPADRDAWRETCTGAAAREAAGVVVDAEPILLDILRNPNPTGDRRDLNVASG